MKLFGGIVEIATISEGQYPGDTTGDSMIATLKGSADKGETAQIYSQPGFVGKAHKGQKGIRLRVGSIDVIISAINYNVSNPVNYGETKIYSTDEDGAEQATHYLDNSSVHTFNSGTDYAVAFEDLQTAFDQLKADHDDLVSKYNLHVHSGVSSGGTTSGVTTTVDTPSTADISGAKVEEIRIP